MSLNISSSQINYYPSLYPENRIFAIVKVRNKKKWTKEEDIKLIKLAEKNKEKHWKEISKNFVNKNPLQCFSRYKRIKPGIIKGTWSKEEDDRILSMVNIYGKSWSKLAKIMRSRNGKQIRDRFINVLDPEVKKGKFSYKEDRKIKELYLKYGPRWATIARALPNRTPDMIKNRFHSSIKKYLYQKNFLTKGENKSKIEPNSVKTSNKSEAEISDSIPNNSNFNSNYNLSNCKSNLDKNFSINFSSNCSYNKDVLINQNNNNQKKSIQIQLENKFKKEFHLTCEAYENINSPMIIRNNQNFHFENLKNVYNQKDFKSNAIFFNKLVSKAKNIENADDSNRTVSNSDYSERDIGSGKNCYEEGKYFQTDKKIENLFEFPDEQFQNANFMNCNHESNIHSTNILENSNNIKDFKTSNQKNYNHKYNKNVNSFKNNIDLCDKEINMNYPNQEKLKNLNQTNDFKNNNNLKNIGYSMSNSSNLIKEIITNDKNKSNKLFESNDIQIKLKENNSKNINFNLNSIIKNEQEFKIEKTSKNLENYFSNNSNYNENNSIKEKTNCDVFINQTNFLSNSKYQINQESDFEQQTCKNNQLQFFNENSRSTNLVTYPNLSSNTSNVYSLEENDNFCRDNVKNANGNPFFFNPVEENYQINFLNFPDSPFRMKSPKYFDFEDFFNSN